MEYKGELKGFPTEIVERMLDEQVKQGNRRDVTVFEENRCLCKMVGGIDWRETTQGYGFCHDVISCKKFNLFFQKYPKKNKYPKLMMVDDIEITETNKGNKRVVFMEKNGHYIAWWGFDNFKDAEKELSTTTWKYAKDIQETTELSMQEIADKFGIEVYNLKIKQ